jgi:glutamate dehydrogenase
VSPEMKDRFDLSKSQVTPTELMQAILKAEVELLWFGGIGTYVKSTQEANSDAGDRANDSLRISSPDLRCKVIGEGANLGVTQRGRIQFAKLGGRLNTDSVDNSAGVDCSDHEVNIKILLDAVVADKKLNEATRNKLLERMTDEVGELVLRDNYLQTQSMTLVQSQDAELLDIQARFIRMLEKSGRLDRAVEFLPDDETLAERELNHQGLTRPEIAVVMPYAKLWMYDEILASNLPDAPELKEDLIEYFPTPLRKTYEKQIMQHKLRREIIATVVTNSMINRVGGTFVTNLMEKSGASPVDIARGYIATRDAFDLEPLWQGIEALDNIAAADTQITLLRDVNELIERATLWLLRHAKQPIDIGATIREFQSGIKQLSGKIEKIVPKEVVDRVNFRANRYISAGVPAALAKQIAYLRLLVSALDVIRAASASKMSLDAVAALYFQVGETFGMGWLRYNAEKLPADSHWQKLAAAAMIEELYGHQRGVTLRIMRDSKGKGDVLKVWSKKNEGLMDQTAQMLNELEAGEVVDLSMLAVASRQLSSIAGG